MTAKISASNNQRLKNILETIANQQNISHIDGLLDCLNALVYEINVKTTGKTKNFQNLLKRLLPNSEYIQKQRININDFTILKVVGKGAYGEVALVRHTTSQEVFALKTMNKAEMVKRDEALCLWEEREIMAFSESEWIVKMLYAFQDTINIYMVMEFVQGGNMVNVMSSYDVDEEMAKFYIAEISLALDFLHNMGFIHRDVKPDNMLLDKNGHIKLCDFGTCVRMNKNGKVVCNVAVGTPDYISPEVLSSQSSNVTYGRECDWWSVGVFLYELLLGDTPFYSQSLVGTYSKILSHAKTLKIPEDAEISKETKDLIHAFLCSSEVRLGRNGIEEIKKHPFFKDVLWKWDEIRTFTPPIVPELVNEIDTSCFDFEEQTDKELLPLAKSALPLNGDHIPFIGFTFNRDFKLKACDLDLVQSGQININSKLSPPLAIKSDKTLEIKVDSMRKTIDEKEQCIRETAKNLELQQIKYIELEQKFQQQILLNSQNIYKDENSQLKSKLKSIESELTEYVQNVKILEAQLKFLKITELEIKSRYDDVLNENIPLKEELEILKHSKKDLKAELEKLTNQFEQSKINITDLISTQSQLKSDYANLIAEFDNLKSTFECHSIQQLRDLIISIRSENNSLQTKIVSYDSTIKKYEEMLKKQKPNENVDNLQLNLKVKNLMTEKAALEAQVEELNKRCTEITDKNNIFVQNCRDLKTENISFSTRISELTFKYANLSLGESRLIKERDELLQKSNDLEAKFNKTLTVLHNCEKQLSEFNQQITFAELKINTHSQKIEELKKEIIDNQALTSQLKISHEELIAHTKELKDSIAAKDNEIVHLNNNVQNLDAQVSMYAKDFRDILAPTEINTSLSGLDSISHLATNSYEPSDLQRKYDALKFTSDKLIESEKILKEEAIKKLNQIMSFPAAGRAATLSIKHKNQYRVERKFEQQYKQLQMDLNKAVDKSAEAAKGYEAKINDLNNTITELQTAIETYKKEKFMDRSNSNSPSNTKQIVRAQLEINELITKDSNQIIKQSFLSIPLKSAKSSRKLVWNRVIVTLTNKSVTLYKEGDITDANIINKIKIELIYYVRAISQNDLIRSSAQDLPKIFQIIYSDEESISNEPQVNEISGEKCTIISNHCLINIQYHMPATCDVCGKGLWGFIKSSYAMECKKCHFKCHRDHVNDPKTIPGCRDYDKRRMAKEIILMAPSAKEQHNWIEILLNLMKISASTLPGSRLATTQSKSSFNAKNRSSEDLILKEEENSKKS